VVVLARGSEEVATTGQAESGMTLVSVMETTEI